MGWAWPCKAPWPCLHYIMYALYWTTWLSIKHRFKLNGFWFDSPEAWISCTVTSFVSPTGFLSLGHTRTLYYHFHHFMQPLIVIITLTNHVILKLWVIFNFSFPAGSVFRPWREPAQSPNPPAPEVNTHTYTHTHYSSAIERWTMNLILWCSAIDWSVTSLSYLSLLLSYSVLSSLRLRIQPSSPPPTHPSNHLFRQPNQSPPPGSAGIMQGHG